MTTGIPGAGAHEHWNDRLSLYLDGELESAERARLETHVAECAACAVALAELREVMARARSLEDRPPATDLWPAIEARLEPRAAARPARRAVIVEGPAWWGRRFDLGLPQLAAAAVLLVTLSGIGMWLALRGPVLPGTPSDPAGPVAGGVPPAQSPGRTDPATAGGPLASAPAPSSDSARGGTAAPGAINDAVTVNLDDPRYDAAIAELERTLAEGRGKLEPRTLAVVEENLRIIDRAIADARRAIEADPKNIWLRSHLAANMKRKVDLLRSATLLATTS